MARRICLRDGGLLLYEESFFPGEEADRFFDHLRRANLNVQETENIVFEGAEAAVARINLDGRPSAVVCERINAGNEDVFDLQVIDLNG